MTTIVIIYFDDCLKLLWKMLSIAWKCFQYFSITMKIFNYLANWNWIYKNFAGTLFSFLKVWFTMKNCTFFMNQPYWNIFLYLKAFSTAIALGYKTESTTAKDTIAVVSNIHVKTPATPVYEIQFLSTAEIPRVNMLRNKVSGNQCYRMPINNFYLLNHHSTLREI